MHKHVHQKRWMGMYFLSGPIRLSGSSLTTSERLIWTPPSSLRVGTPVFSSQPIHSVSHAEQRVGSRWDSFISLIARKSRRELLMKGIRLRLTIHFCQPIRLGAEGQLRRTTVVRITGSAQWRPNRLNNHQLLQVVLRLKREAWWVLGEGRDLLSYLLFSNTTSQNWARTGPGLPTTGWGGGCRVRCCVSLAVPICFICYLYCFIDSTDHVHDVSQFLSEPQCEPHIQVCHLTTASTSYLIRWLI